MMAQWTACKQKAKEALLLFRLGDFYEAFYEDAKLLSDAVDVTLTKRQEVPMSGVPAQAVEGYIEKLVEKGLLVAVAEQIEDPKTTKGIVKRDVVRVVSPGTLLSSLPEKDNNFFGCLVHLNKTFALALLDLSTGELRVSEATDIQTLQDELTRRDPSELLVSEKDAQIFSSLLKEFRLRITSKEHWHFDSQTTFTTLAYHFKVHSLDGFGLQGMVAATTAAGALLSHVQDELSLSTTHIKAIHRDELSSYMAIDRATQRNLELTEPLHQGGKNFTLLKLLDHTQTPMGARLFKTWLTHPLLSVDRINKRQEGVEELMGHLSLKDSLRPIRDLERLMMRISSGSATPRDLMGLKISLDALPAINETIDAFNSPLFQALKLPDVSSIAEEIGTTLVEDPPAKLGEGKVIHEGIHKELDELRSLKSNSQEWIAKYQTELKEVTGIKNLKIIFSKAFGYCIEVSRGQADQMPLSFQRRQTLVNNERFISPELKAYEEKILTAEEKIQEIESALYHTLRKKIAEEIDKVLTASRSIATLDALLSLATAAVTYRFTKPKMDEGNQLDIEVGRHPVIEAALLDASFVPNDIHLAPISHEKWGLDQSRQLLLITGPNMAGKSTYIRQVALITIMAQIGSFVPAKRAHIGMVDKVFSRIGASDDLSRGQSTFMIEMTETANILHHATPRSLVILDEIGRGTSTFDGISIAWAVAEHLLKVGCKTLFATHYWELTELEKHHKGAANVHVAVQETADQIVFLRKIVEGSTDKSYGIHVARLAGLPQAVLKRAHDVLHRLESKKLKTPPPSPPPQEQLSFFSPQDTLKQELKALDLNNTTPMAALELLHRWKKSL